MSRRVKVIRLEGGPDLRTALLSIEYREGWRLVAVDSHNFAYLERFDRDGLFTEAAEVSIEETS